MPCNCKSSGVRKENIERGEDSQQWAHRHTAPLPEEGYNTRIKWDGTTGSVSVSFSHSNNTFRLMIC